MTFVSRTMNSAMLPQNLWGELHRQVLDGLRQLPPDDPRLRELPPRFYAAFPLDDSSKRKGTAGAFGYPSATYKVASKADGHLYALCRLDKVRTTAKIVASVAEKWNSLQPHPSIVTLRGCFYQAGALFFINDYHPCAESLWERYIVCRTLNQVCIFISHYSYDCDKNHQPTIHIYFFHHHLLCLYCIDIDHPDDYINSIK